MPSCIQVVAVDARNHGDSIHTEEMNYFLFRDDVLRLMDQQEIEQAVLIGHSMGGKTAMTTALTNVRLKLPPLNTWTMFLCLPMCDFEVNAF